jgi:hypothetical protein
MSFVAHLVGDDKWTRYVDIIRPGRRIRYEAGDHDQTEEDHDGKQS